MAKVRYIMLSLGTRLLVDPKKSTSFGPVELELDIRDPSMRRMLAGAYEIEVRRTIQKYLSKGGTFLDVGANIGYYSALAAHLVGPSGRVHSFEPVPTYFAALKSLANRNPFGNIVANQAALGEEEGSQVIYVSNDGNIGWNTMVPGSMSQGVIGSQYSVSVTRLDDYLIRNNVRNVSLIKIDVEGYELPVLKGLERFLEIERPPIVCEVSPPAYQLLGYATHELFDYLARFSYQPYTLYTGREERTSIDLLSSSKQYDLLFRPCGAEGG